MKTTNQEIEGMAGWLKYLVQWEAAVGEGIGISFPGDSAEGTNIFGRKPIMGAQAPLEFAAGLALAGIRSAAFIPGESCRRLLPVLEDITRQHIPLVVYVYSGTVGELVPVLDRLPCLLLSASKPREAIEMALLARWVTEKSLLPALIILENVEEDQPAPVLPDNAEITAYLGNPDERIAAPTAAQEMVFGAHRRRVPLWFNYDLPVLQGAEKDARARAVETLAREYFFDQPLNDLLEQAKQAFQHIFAHPVKTFRMLGDVHAEGCVVSNGADLSALEKGLERYQHKGKRRMSSLEVMQWRPFPAEALGKMLRSVRYFTITEPPASGFGQWFRSAFDRQSALTWIYGTRLGPLHSEEAEGIFLNMDKGGRGLTGFLAGQSSGLEKSPLPQYEVLLQGIKRAYPGLAESVLVTSEQVTAKVDFQPKLSGFARQYKDGGPPYARLSHFAQHTVYVRQLLPGAEAVPDPFKAIPLLPAASAALGRWGASREQIPRLDPEKCTACGICSIACPHAAMPGLVLHWEGILRGGMEMLARQGRPVSSLTPLVKPLANLLNQKIAGWEKSLPSVPSLLQEAFESVAKTVGLKEGRLDAAQKEMAVLSEHLLHWPLIATEALFHSREAEEAGTGWMFGLFSDPGSCTGCGICAGTCPEDALSMTEPDNLALEAEANRFLLWEGMPDTVPETMHSLKKSGGLLSLAALYWNKGLFRSFAGGAEVEVGADAQALVHALQIVLRNARQGTAEGLNKQLAGTIDQLSEKIHLSLSDALPRKTFQELSGALSQVKADKIPLDSLLSGLGEDTHLRKVDVGAMRRQVEMLEQLQNLSWLRREGPTGQGRAPFGLVISGSFPGWLGQHPYNHFTVPVLLNLSGNAGGWAAGLLQGHLRHYLDEIRIVRRGELEVKGRNLAEKSNAMLADLSWKDLSGDEQSGFPPLIFLSFGDDPLPLDLFPKPLPGFFIRISPNPNVPAAAGWLENEKNAGRTSDVYSLADPDLFIRAVEGMLSSQKPEILHLQAPLISGNRMFFAGYSPADSASAASEMTGAGWKRQNIFWQQREAELQERHTAEIERLKEEQALHLKQAEESWKKSARERLRDNLIKLSKTKR